MTNVQKLIAVAGLAAMLGTTIWAPYDYRGYQGPDMLQYSRGRPDYAVQGVIHAPLWKTPSHDLVKSWIRASPREHLQVTSLSLNIEEVKLNAGKLALWWAGIAVAAAVAMVISAPSRRE